MGERGGRGVRGQGRGERGEGKRGVEGPSKCCDWPSLLTLYSLAKPLVLISSWTCSLEFLKGNTGELT